MGGYNKKGKNFGKILHEKKDSKMSRTWDKEPRDRRGTEKVALRPKKRGRDIESEQKMELPKDGTQGTSSHETRRGVNIKYKERKGETFWRRPNRVTMPKCRS